MSLTAMTDRKRPSSRKKDVRQRTGLPGTVVGFTMVVVALLIIAALVLFL